MKERKQYLDILRVVAITLVVLTHSVPPASSTVQSSSIQAFISVICSPSSELFIAISGALLLPVRRPTKEFLKKRFLRVFPPLLFWSFIIIIYRFFTEPVPLNETLKALLFIPIKPVIGVYWFFYVISGLYIFAPIISKWLLNVSKREIRFFIFLWGITLALSSIGILFNTRLININGSYYFILNSFGGFLGYMILGSYLRNYDTGRTLMKNIVIPLGILFFILTIAVIGYKLRIITADFFIENLSLTTALMVYSFFMLLKDLRIENQIITKVISEIALCSYGIYLIHIFIARGFVWNMIGFIGLADCNPIIKISVTLVLSLTFSYIMVRLIKFSPYSKYIVG